VSSVCVKNNFNCFFSCKSIEWGYMKNYQDKGARSEGFRRGGDDRKEGFKSRPTFQKKSWGGDRLNDRDAFLHKAVCSECSKSCDVPFKPSNDKPVYCRDCFASKRNADTAAYEANKFSSGRPSSQVVSSHSEVKVARVPGEDGMKRHLMDISSKLETLIIAVEKMSASKKEMSKEASAPVSLPQAKTVKNVSKVVTKNTTAKNVDTKKTEDKKEAAQPVAKVTAKVAAKKAPVVVAKKVAAKAPVKTIKKVVVTKKVAVKKAK
jgi:CxxC-x17-CxxC domain-containing protein